MAVVLSDDFKTVLTLKGRLLLLLETDPMATVRTLAQDLGVTERTIYQVLSELESEGRVKCVTHGRRVQRVVVSSVYGMFCDHA